MVGRRKATMIAVAAVIATTLVLTEPVAAQTTTVPDPLGDVDVWADWSDAPESPYAEAIDLETLRIRATARTVTITLRVADVLTVSKDYAQEFTANLIWARRSGHFVTGRKTVVLAASDRTEWGPECRGDKFVGDDLREIDARVTCSRDVEDDRVTLRIPTSVFPRSAKYLRIHAESWSFVASTSSGWEISSRDSVGADSWTRIG